MIKKTLLTAAILLMLVHAYNAFLVPNILTKKLDIIRLVIARVSITDIRSMFPEAQKKQTDIQWIIVHHDAIQQNAFEYAPISVIIQHHNEKFGRFAYHYYIDKAGKIYQAYSQTAVQPHALSYNENSLGICLSGDFMYEYPTEPQIKAYQNLMFLLTTQHPNAHVLGHRETGNKTTCPGDNFNYNNY